MNKYESVFFFYFQPENVMLLNHNSNRIKLIDFGLSRKFKPGKEFREMLGTPEFVGNLNLFLFHCLSFMI